MSYLRATTTWGNLIPKMIALASGAEADDYAVTAAVGDRWQNHGDSLITPPASTYFAISQEHRAGYWTRTDDNVYFRDGTAGAQTYMKQTAIWSNWHANFGEIVTVTARISTINTTPGDYSTARITLAAHSTSAARANTSLLTRTVMTPNADGTYTWTYASGYTMTLQIGDPSGTVALDSYFMRNFSNTARGGYDYFRNVEHATATPTFTIAPPGVENTDWEWCRMGTWIPAKCSSGYSTSYIASPRGNSATWGWAGYCPGIGIKTNTALTGDRYTVDFSITDCLIRLQATTNTITFMYGNKGTDGSSTVRWGLGGDADAVATILSPFSGTPVSGTAIQLWMSVTPEWLCVVVNGDTGPGGTLSGFQIGRVTQDNAADVRGCWAVGCRNGTSQEWKSFWRLGPHQLWAAMDRKGPGWRDGGRDWQTGYGRNDIWNAVNSTWHCYGDFSGIQTTDGPWTTYARLVVTNASASSTNQIYGIPYSMDRATYPNGIDPTWPMGLFQLADNGRGETNETTNPGEYRARGYLKTALLPTPVGGWTSGDELTDTVSGDKYMLFQPVGTYFGWPYSMGAALKEV